MAIKLRVFCKVAYHTAISKTNLNTKIVAYSRPTHK